MTAVPLHRQQQLPGQWHALMQRVPLSMRECMFGATWVDLCCRKAMLMLDNPWLDAAGVVYIQAGSLRAMSYRSGALAVQNTRCKNTQPGRINQTWAVHVCAIDMTMYHLLRPLMLQLSRNGFSLFSLQAIQQHTQQFMTVLLLEPLHASMQLKHRARRPGLSASQHFKDAVTDCKTRRCWLNKDRGDHADW